MILELVPCEREATVDLIHRKWKLHLMELASMTSVVILEGIAMTANQIAYQQNQIRVREADIKQQEAGVKQQEANIKEKLERYENQRLQLDVWNALNNEAVKAQAAVIQAEAAAMNASTNARYEQWQQDIARSRQQIDETAGWINVIRSLLPFNYPLKASGSNLRGINSIVEGYDQPNSSNNSFNAQTIQSLY